MAPLKISGERTFAMSVDVEDYLHAWALSPAIKREDWSAWPSRVEAATMRIIDLFDRQQIKGTFFVLGWVAKRAPLLVREIIARGHELASHGFHHDKVHELSPTDFREDVRATRLLLEDLSGVAVQGFRAPSFSINDCCWWAYDQLREAGYRYSSSVHPIAHDHYGMPTAPLAPFRPTDSDLIEIPVATIEVLGRRVSCAGGGHFRLFPYRWSKWCLGRLARENERTGAFYFHPWEIDPGQPRVQGLPLRSKFRHYTGLGAMERKLKRLFSDFRWDRMDRLYGLSNAAPAANSTASS
ncbi:MAG: XrtA system polysaccharide deacetylase [Geminicoccaceae bacterium]